MCILPDYKNIYQKNTKTTRIQKISDKLKHIYKKLQEKQ